MWSVPCNLLLLSKLRPDTRREPSTPSGLQTPQRVTQIWSNRTPALRVPFKEPRRSATTPARGWRPPQAAGRWPQSGVGGQQGNPGGDAGGRAQGREPHRRLKSPSRGHTFPGLEHRAIQGSSLRRMAVGQRACQTLGGHSKEELHSGLTSDLSLRRRWRAEESWAVLEREAMLTSDYPVH